MTNKLLVEQWIEEAAKKNQPAPKAPERKLYCDKLVAWIDVLGMRNKMKRSDDADEIFDIMEKLLHFVKNACEDLCKKEGLNFLQLSDGFIIIADTDHINEICKILCKIQWHVLLYSEELKLLRGALTVGKVSISDDEKLIIGPAFIEAYAMESDNAIFPRILFANEISEQIKNINFNFIKEDGDHFKYLDFINYMVETEKLTTKQLTHLLETHGVFKVLKNNYEKYIHENKAIAQKYGWLISKLSEKEINILRIN